MYNLVCFDIDGTLLNKERTLSEYTIKVLRNLTIPFVLASSRMPKAMKYFYEQIGISNGSMICYNGALTINSIGEYICDIGIPAEVLKFISSFKFESEFNMSVYAYDNWYTSAEDYWTLREINNTRAQPIYLNETEISSILKINNHKPHKIMCMGDIEIIEELSNNLNNVFENDLNLYRSKPTYLEITAKNINKASALALLNNAVFRVKPESIIAFGDNMNDIELLKFAGLGVAVSNANPEVLNIADLITDSNINDGVAKSLVEILKLDIYKS